MAEQREPWQMTKAEFFQRGEEPLTARLAHSTLTFRREVHSNLRKVRGKMVDQPKLVFIEMGTGVFLSGQYLHLEAVRQAINED